MDELTCFRNELIENCCFRMDESLRMITIALSQLTDEQLWQKPNDSLNSVANLILHLCGNMTQYGIASLQGIEDKRNRNLEFDTKEGHNKTALLNLLKKTVSEVKTSIRETGVPRLLEKKEVQGFIFSGIGNCIHVVEHFSYHAGQIAFWVKFLNDAQLGFYEGYELNKKT